MFFRNFNSSIVGDNTLMISYTQFKHEGKRLRSPILEAFPLGGYLNENLQIEIKDPSVYFNLRI